MASLAVDDKDLDKNGKHFLAGVIEYKRKPNFGKWINKKSGKWERKTIPITIEEYRILAGNESELNNLMDDKIADWAHELKQKINRSFSYLHFTRGVPELLKNRILTARKYWFSLFKSGEKATIEKVDATDRYGDTFPQYKFKGFDRNAYMNAAYSLVHEGRKLAVHDISLEIVQLTNYARFEREEAVSRAVAFEEEMGEQQGDEASRSLSAAERKKQKNKRKKDAQKLTNQRKKSMVKQMETRKAAAEKGEKLRQKKYEEKRSKEKEMALKFPERGFTPIVSTEKELKFMKKLSPRNSQQSEGFENELKEKAFFGRKKPKGTDKGGKKSRKKRKKKTKRMRKKKGGFLLFGAYAAYKYLSSRKTNSRRKRKSKRKRSHKRIR